MFKGLAIAASAALLSMAAAYEGEGTFYGAGGNGARGACMLQPGFNGVGITVAMNAAQYEGSCGKCVKIEGKGQGLGHSPIVGPIYATVDNLCPECKHGDVDLGLAGDGRWHISWDFIDCKEARAAASSLPPGSHRRALRGADEQAMVLEPGYMVTADGIKLIADVIAN